MIKSTNLGVMAITVGLHSSLTSLECKPTADDLRDLHTADKAARLFANDKHGAGISGHWSAELEMRPTDKLRELAAELLRDGRKEYADYLKDFVPDIYLGPVERAMIRTYGKK